MTPTPHDGRCTTDLRPLSLRISPPLLVSFLSEGDKRQNTLLVDFDASRVSDKNTEFAITIIFSPIAVRRGVLTRIDYYIGGTGAEIRLIADKGAILTYTQSATIQVEITRTTSREKKASLSVAPTFSSKANATEVEIGLGEAAAESSRKDAESASYSTHESYLAATRIGCDEVVWNVTLPLGEHVVRSFLLGNLDLNAICSWARSLPSGRLAVRPSDVTFFDGQRQPLGALRSLVMAYVLWRRGIAVLNRDGCEITFEEHGEPG